MSNFSFKAAFEMLRAKDQSAVKGKIMTALGITTRDSWRRRVNGLIEPKVTEAKAIEEIFSEYGINTVWDHEYSS